MSQENVEIIRSVAAAISRGDWDAALSHLAPNVNWDISRQLNEERGIYETRESVGRVWERFAEPWESWRVEVDEFVEVGEDTVVTRGTGYFRGRGGIEVPARQSGVWTFRDGAVSKFTSYDDHQEALEAAGLRE